LIKYFIIVLFSFSLLFAQTKENETSSYLTKQKLEVKELKKELNLFYNQKEKEYQDRKKELDDILKKIQSEKNAIQQIHDDNRKILDDINGVVQSKTTKIYNAMKPKIAAKIFDAMIAEDKIEDVFDIILKLKERNVTSLMKFLSVQNAAILTEMLENYNVENEIKGE